MDILFKSAHSNFRWNTEAKGCDQVKVKTAKGTFLVQERDGEILLKAETGGLILTPIASNMMQIQEKE